MIAREVLVSIKIGDGVDNLPTDELVDDLRAMTHQEASEHYHRVSGCESIAYAEDRNGGRHGFGAQLVAIGCSPEQIHEYLGEWDEYSRPVAVIHWFTEP